MAHRQRTFKAASAIAACGHALTNAVTVSTTNRRSV